ncbi:MAG: phosphatidate cytidylyltransferase [Treponema sp.]|nr:phosphatidate cytidylyltransferase [Treponema sp.]
MKKVIERLLVFLIGIPLIACLVLLLTHYNNLALNIAAILMSGIGAVEFSSMLEKKQIRVPKVWSFILGALAPLALTLNISLGLPDWLVSVIIMSGAGLALISGVFSRSSQIETVLSRTIGCFSLLVYPGFFMYWLIKMTVWQNPGAILLFLSICFASDSIAWLFGTLMGANNRGIIAVSPNKSIAGFIGGIIGSVAVAILAALLFPVIFPVDDGYTATSLILIATIIGFCTGIAAMFGDLAESAIKRSCEFKDSGNLMLGRGGILDSIDSIVVAAPIFYMMYHLIFII